MQLAQVKHQKQKTKTKTKRPTYKNALVVLFHSSGCRLKQINGDSSFSKRLSSASMLSGNWFLVNQETPPFGIPTVLWYGYSYMIKTIGLKHTHK
jgi:hypothetical protein